MQWLTTVTHSKKVTIRQLQCLSGLLNYLTKAIRPGRAFIRCIYNKLKNLPPHYHISVDKQTKLDCLMWLKFLHQKSAYSPIPTFKLLSNKEVQLFTDTTAKPGLGFGCYFQGKWTFGVWPSKFIKSKPSIALLELFPIVVSIVLWGQSLQNKQVVLYSDNKAAVTMANKQTAKCPLCMALICILVLQCLKFNLELKFKYIQGCNNVLSDALSHLKFG